MWSNFDETCGLPRNMAYPRTLCWPSRGSITRRALVKAATSCPGTDWILGVQRPVAAPSLHPSIAPHPLSSAARVARPPLPVTPLLTATTPKPPRYSSMASKASLVVAFVALTASTTALTTSTPYTKLYPVVCPTASPTVTDADGWTCYTEDATNYLFMPTPTGELQKAHESFGSSLIETCLTSGRYSQPCPFPDQSRWCGFSTAMPASLLQDYTSYVLSASSWWQANSASIIWFAEACPKVWYQASNFGVFGGHVHLNHTLIHMECFAEANPTDTLSATGPTATPGQGPTGGESTATRTGTSTTTTITTISSDGTRTWRPRRSLLLGPLACLLPSLF